MRAGQPEVHLISMNTLEIFTYYPLPKCASSAMVSYFQKYGDGYTRNQKGYIKPNMPETRWTVVRHPVKRILSAYMWFWAARGFSWKEFWSVIRDNPQHDYHTTPQVKIIEVFGGIDFASCLEDLDAWWPRHEARWPHAFKEIKPGNNNATKKHRYEAFNFPTEDYDDILRVYAEDLELWEISRLS